VSPFTGETRQEIIDKRHRNIRLALVGEEVLAPSTEIDLFTFTDPQGDGRRPVLKSKKRHPKADVVLVREAYVAYKTNLDTYWVQAVFDGRFFNREANTWMEFGTWLTSSATHCTYEEAHRILEKGKL
jgi:hypothetical protein